MNEEQSNKEVGRWIGAVVTIAIGLALFGMMTCTQTERRLEVACVEAGGSFSRVEPRGCFKVSVTREAIPVKAAP